MSSSTIFSLNNGEFYPNSPAERTCEVVPLQVRQVMQVPPIKLLSNGETYVINRAGNSANPIQQTGEEHDCSDTSESEMEITEMK
jgi:hypothetical protein